MYVSKILLVITIDAASSLCRLWNISRKKIVQVFKKLLGLSRDMLVVSCEDGQREVL